MVPAAFKAQAGKTNLTLDGQEYSAALPLSGTWQGLPVRSLLVTGRIESEQGFYLVLDAGPAQVLEAANRAGFAIPESGSEYRDDDVLGVSVGVAPYEGGGALYCLPG